MSTETMNFKFLINDNGNNIIAKPITNNDADKVINFAKVRTISGENYKQMFGIGCEAEFIKMGALIETTGEEIHEVAKSPDNYFSVGLWSTDSELLGYLFIQLEDLDDFLVNKKDITFNIGFEDRWEKWMEYKSGNKMTYKGDIAILSGEENKNLFFIMIYISAIILTRMGRVCLLSEAFHINKCIDKEGTHIVDINNKRSFVAQIVIGGAEYVGDGKTVRKTLNENLKIEYYAKLLEYNFETLVTRCLEKAENLNIIFEEI